MSDLDLVADAGKALTWLGHVFQNKLEAADGDVVTSAVEFYRNPSLATRNAMMGKIEAAIAANVASFQQSQPAAVPVDPEPSQPEAGAGGQSIYQGTNAVK